MLVGGGLMQSDATSTRCYMLAYLTNKKQLSIIQLPSTQMMAITSSSNSSFKTPTYLYLQLVQMLGSWCRRYWAPQTSCIWVLNPGVVRGVTESAGHAQTESLSCYGCKLCSVFERNFLKKHGWNEVGHTGSMKQYFDEEIPKLSNFICASS